MKTDGVDVLGLLALWQDEAVDNLELLGVVLLTVEGIARLLLLNIEPADDEFRLITGLRQDDLLLTLALDEADCIFQHFVFFIFSNVLLRLLTAIGRTVVLIIHLLVRLLLVVRILLALVAAAGVLVVVAALGLLGHRVQFGARPGCDIVLINGIFHACA